MAPWSERSLGCVLGIHPSVHATYEGTAMKEVFKSQTFRAVMILSALASSSLVLMAGRRSF